ncbi:uncharacterized protein PV09_09831 [Verruconis gallopava]|uniref:Uncharacterized protein n=1 Tax=Verruconis gallopava TaxID=253628 RepID=A0A0D1ZWB7_9PEZI|nr:uncharacterized protein PV09_09831 [Verruconis gallopava]KIV98324.1 hypothetical protein PV09_09831 [Verruconis gallopava]
MKGLIGCLEADDMDKMMTALSEARADEVLQNDTESTVQTLVLSQEAEGPTLRMQVLDALQSLAQIHIMHEMMVLKLQTEVGVGNSRTLTLETFKTNQNNMNERISFLIGSLEADDMDKMRTALEEADAVRTAVNENITKTATLLQESLIETDNDKAKEVPKIETDSGIEVEPASQIKEE